MKKTLALIPAAAVIAGSVMLVHSSGVFATPKTTTLPKQTVKEVQSTDGDSLRYVSLTAADYAEVAGELGISVACIRAVVDIEAGNKGEGFNADHTPLINFDLTMFRQAARRRGVNLEKYKSSGVCRAQHPQIRLAASRAICPIALRHDHRQHCRHGGHILGNVSDWRIQLAPMWLLIRRRVCASHVLLRARTT
jgi:hypothetical protein